MTRPPTPIQKLAVAIGIVLQGSIWGARAIEQPAPPAPMLSILSTNATVNVSGDALATQQRTNDRSADALTKGTEQNPCGQAGVLRVSEGEAKAAVDYFPPGPATMTVTLNVFARAVGGQTTDCSGCTQPCGTSVVRRTTAKTASAAEAQIKVAFDASLEGAAYALHIGGQQHLIHNSFTFEVFDGDTSVVQGNSLNAPDVAVDATPARPLRIVLRLTEDAEEQGGCCEESFPASVTADIRLTPTARSAVARDQKEHVIGGTPTDEFPEVGALLYQGRSHCTATLIARRTILTAAHCLDLYPSQELLFLLSPSVSDVATAQPDKLWQVVDRAYPSSFNREAKVDDIGVAYLRDRVLTIDPATLYDGLPPLPAYYQDTPPTFVGYGYGEADGSLSGQGRKRYAPIPVIQTAPKWFTNGIPATSDGTVSIVNTCDGDSGGPAFMFRNNSRERQLIGVVSRGDPGCRIYGINTRIDSYRDWINQHKR